ncbi:hypothetical protein ABT294_08125 [Nonomuraea sp. NPDC000554]|uniref:hypothetical protein n=1 Tax=Nonomuraea sp. NPDC000554 TaxID=3154259 RepID=UPI00332FF93B
MYGGRETRSAIRHLGYRYVAALKSDHRVRTPAGTTYTVTDLAARVPARSWQRLRTGHGTKGDRHYEWAMIGVLADDTPTTSRTDTARCWSAGTATPALCRSIGAGQRPVDR